MDVYIGRPVNAREEELVRGPAAEAILRRNTRRCAYPDVAPASCFAPKLFFQGERLISSAKAISARHIKVAALVGLMSTIVFSLPSEAQSQRRATGLIPAAPEELAKFPKAPRMRAFLPELVDLSKRFPAVGSQGNQGSCVGWAVGYAARSYYTAVEKEKPRPDRSEIASPAYIYRSGLAIATMAHTSVMP